MIPSEPIVAAGNANKIILALAYSQDSMELTAKVRAIAKLRNTDKEEVYPVLPKAGQYQKELLVFVRGVFLFALRGAVPEPVATWLFERCSETK